VAQTRHHKIHFAFPCFRIFNFCISMFPHFHIFAFSCFRIFIFSCFCIFIFSYFHVSVFSYFRIFIFSYFHVFIFCTVVIFIVIVYFGTDYTLFRQYTTANLLKVDLVINYIIIFLTLLNSFKVICLHAN
jgi:hypothetical protein